jgi:hypothetical protein
MSSNAQTGAKIDVTLRRAKATHVGFGVQREAKVEIVAPGISEIAREGRRHRCIGNRAPHKIPEP